jgi:hypothetical protein
MKVKVSKRIYYVYGLYRDVKMLDPFYIGKGQRRRINFSAAENVDEHCTNIRKRNAIRKRIRELGFVPRKIIRGRLLERDALAYESILILKFGRINNGTGRLANLTDGGEGMSGHIPSKETNEKRRASLTGRKRSLEECAAISAGKKGIPAWNKGKPSPRKGIPITQEHRDSISRGRLASSKPSEAAKKLWADEAYRASMSGKNSPMYGRPPPATAREATTKRNNKNWADPIYRAKQTEINRKAAKDRMSDPVTRARTIAAVIASNKRRAKKNKQAAI